VQSTRRLSTIIHHALERLAVCSNDPVCADHESGSAIDERALLGAACHGCLLIPETSCERRNNWSRPWPAMGAAYSVSVDPISGRL
jgi:hypothetical protein